MKKYNKPIFEVDVVETMTVLAASSEAIETEDIKCTAVTDSYDEKDVSFPFGF